MSKLKTFTAHLEGKTEEHGGVVQRMTFQAEDKQDAKEFAEREALREAEGVVAGRGLQDAEHRKAVKERTFKVVKVEES